MYNCVLWSGANLPFPTMDDEPLARNNGWEPLFASKQDIPLFWWFLLDRFNCFWMADGAPIFVVDRASVLARADARYAKLKEAMLPGQCEAWVDFYERIETSSGDIFSIQLPKLWQRRFFSRADHFNSHMEKSLKPLEGGAYGTRQQQELRVQSIINHFQRAGLESPELSGECLTPM